MVGGAIMEIPFFHEETFAPAGILESHTSLVYRQCFGEIAKFTINVPLDDNSKQYVGESFLVELERDRGLYGITTRVEKETKNGKSVLSFSGKTTQLYLQDRIVWDTYNGEANLSTMGYDVVDRNADPLPDNAGKDVGVISSPACRLRRIKRLARHNVKYKPASRWRVM